MNRRGSLKFWEKGTWSDGKKSCPKPQAEKGEIVSIKVDGGYIIAVGNGDKDPNKWPAIFLDKTVAEVKGGSSSSAGSGHDPHGPTHH